MTLNELVDIYKKIYGDNNVVYYNDSRTWELCPDLIYSLDYDDNDFRNMVAITQNDSGELFLSSNNEDIMAFDTMKQYEIEPVKNNVIKKYGLEVDNYTIVKKLEQFDEEYLKQVTSDFMSAIYDIWFFAINLSFYGFAVLNRGTYYHDEYEQGKMFEGEKFEDVIVKCKHKYPNFYFDKRERLFYLDNNGTKEYLIKYEDGYYFDSLIPIEEEDLIHSAPSFTTQSPEREEAEKVFATKLKDRFCIEDKSYTTIVYENNQPIKLYLKENDGKYYFSDNGFFRQRFGKDISPNRYAALTDNSYIKDNEQLYFVDPDFFTSTQEYATTKLEMELNAIAFKCKDPEVYDFGNIFKFETRLNTIEKVKDAICETSNFECKKQNNGYMFVTNHKYENGKNICLGLEEFEGIGYLTFAPNCEQETLNKILELYKYEGIEFDKTDNKFKLIVFESNPHVIDQKIYEMFCLVIFLINIQKIVEGTYQNSNKTEFDIPATLKEINQKLSSLSLVDSFLSFNTGFIYGGPKNEEIITIRFFTKFLGGLTFPAYFTIENVEGVFCLRSSYIDSALKTNKKLLELVQLFDLEDRRICLSNLETKFANMLRLFLCAKYLGIIKLD